MLIHIYFRHYYIIACERLALNRKNEYLHCKIKKLTVDKVLLLIFIKD